MLKKYKIVQHKGNSFWSVYRRDLLFFWKYETYYTTLENALEYVGMHTANVVIKPKD